MRRSLTLAALVAVVINATACNAATYPKTLQGATGCRNVGTLGGILVGMGASATNCDAAGGFREVQPPTDCAIQFDATTKLPECSAAGGNVVGPAVSVVNNAACWDNITGTLLKDCGATTGDLKADGTVPLTANWDVGAYKITANQLASDVAIGTAPLVITSTTGVSNLNCDLLDGISSAALAILAGQSGGQTLSGGTLTTQDLTLAPNAADSTTGQILLGAGAAYDATESCIAVGKQSCDARANQSGMIESRVSTAATNLPKTAADFSHATSGTAAAGFGTQIAASAENAAGTERTIGRIGWTWSDPTDTSEDATLFFESKLAGSDSTVLSITSAGKGTFSGGVAVQSGDELDIGGGGGTQCKYDPGLDVTQCVIDQLSSIEIRSASYAGDLVASFTNQSTNTENVELYYNGTLIFETLADGVGIAGTSPITFADGSFGACDSLSTTGGVLTCHTGSFTGTFTFDPGSLADGAGETKAFTCTGGALGDIVTVGPGVDVQDMTFSASVQASNACEVRLQNESGAGPTDLPTSTWKFHVRKL